MEKSLLKVTITGAAGNIAYSLLPLLASGYVFGPRTSLHLALLDVPHKEYALKGIVLELEDGAYPVVTKVEYGSDPRAMFKDCDIAIFLGGASRQPGQERRDLLSVNAKIFKEQGEALNEVAKPDCKCLVVANPCNTNCFILQKHCPKLPKKNFTSLIKLDQNRAKGQVAIKLGVEVEKVRKTAIWGNHSWLQFPDLSHAEIDGQKIDALVSEEYIQKEFVDLIQQRAGEVLSQRKKPAVMSAARAIVDHLRDWRFGTDLNDWTSMGVVSDGSYGIPEGLVCSLPVTCKDFEYTIVEGLRLNDFAKGQLQLAIDELIDEKEEAMSELDAVC
jgi:malate dehydrogenase